MIKLLTIKTDIYGENFYICPNEIITDNYTLTSIGKAIELIEIELTSVIEKFLDNLEAKEMLQNDKKIL